MEESVDIRIQKLEAQVKHLMVRPSTSGFFCIPEHEARRLSLIATFLNVHPMGCSIERIFSYISTFEKTIKDHDLENLLQKYPTVFIKESTTNEKWFYFVHKFQEEKWIEEMDKITLKEDDARSVAMLAIFLNVHQCGAPIDYIYSYIRKMDSRVNERDVEGVLRMYPTAFQEVGNGASLGKKWIYVGHTFYNYPSNLEFLS